MKTKTHIILSMMLAIAFQSIVGCSKDNGPDKNTKTGEFYVKYNISGAVINDNFRIFATGEDSDYSNVSLTGGLVVNVESNEGNIKMAAIGYRGFGPTMDDVREVTLNLPARKGSLDVGTLFPGPTYVSSGEPVYNAYFDLFFRSDITLYDHNNDGMNDLTSGLITESMSITITGYEEEINNLGIAGVTHIRGSFQGTGYFKYFTGPNTDPGKLSHTIEGEFEYNKK